MYTIHTTPGFIIDSRPYGEAGKLITIFTRDLGLVTAAATGIRYERSKLRYFAQDHSFGSFSLVRGRELWRLTSAQEAQGERRKEKEERGAPMAQELIARVALLLRRLLHGEEANPGLFLCIESAQRYLSRGAEALGPEASATLESLIVIRIMHRLGYIGAEGELDRQIVSDAIDARILDELSAKRAGMNRAINAALKESHL